MKRSVKVFSPAKVNLRLEIGARREDGYHDAVSVMQALSLHDTVTVSFDDASGEPGALSVSVAAVTAADLPSLDVPQEQNIAYKAAVALAAAYGKGQGSVDIRIDKHIPFQAGLGGGSSNAAAVIVGLCELWGEDPTGERATSVAQGLGADVAFFLHGGCVRLHGRGDAFEARLAAARGAVVLVKPDLGVSTAAAYAAFDELVDQGRAAFPDDGPYVTDGGQLALFNNLAAASEQVLPELAEVRAWLASQPGVARGAEGEAKVLLSGSGSATFAVLDAADSLGNAAAIVAAAKKKGWWARSCFFSPLGASVIEGAQRRTNLGAVHKTW